MNQDEALRIISGYLRVGHIPYTEELAMESALNHTLDEYVPSCSDWGRESDPKKILAKYTGCMDAYFAVLKKWQTIIKPYSEEWADRIDELYKKDALSYDRAVELMGEVIEGKRGKTQKLKDAQHVMSYSTSGVDDRMRMLNRYISEYESGKIPEPLKKYTQTEKTLKKSPKSKKTPKKVSTYEENRRQTGGTHKAIDETEKAKPAGWRYVPDYINKKGDLVPAHFYYEARKNRSDSPEEVKDYEEYMKSMGLNPHDSDEFYFDDWRADVGDAEPDYSWQDGEEEALYNAYAGELEREGVTLPTNFIDVTPTATWKKGDMLFRGFRHPRFGNWGIYGQSVKGRAQGYFNWTDGSVPEKYRKMVDTKDAVLKLILKAEKEAGWKIVPRETSTSLSDKSLEDYMDANIRRIKSVITKYEDLIRYFDQTEKTAEDEAKITEFYKNYRALFDGYRQALPSVESFYLDQTEANFEKAKAALEIQFKGLDWYLEAKEYYDAMKARDEEKQKPKEIISPPVGNIAELRPANLDSFMQKLKNHEFDGLHDKAHRRTLQCKDYIYQMSACFKVSIDILTELSQMNRGIGIQETFREHLKTTAKKADMAISRCTRAISQSETAWNNAIEALKTPTGNAEWILAKLKEEITTVKLDDAKRGIAHKSSYPIPEKETERRKAVITSYSGKIQKSLEELDKNLDRIEAWKFKVDEGMDEIAVNWCISTIDAWWRDLPNLIKAAETSLVADNIMWDRIETEFETQTAKVNTFKKNSTKTIDRIEAKYGENMPKPEEKPKGETEEEAKEGAKPERQNPPLFYIDEGLARRAKEMYSFSDYREGSATTGYRGSVNSAWEKVEAHKKRVDPMHHEKIDSMFEMYSKRLADYINKDNAIIASYPSVMIAGASGFNNRKKAKQNARAESNYQWYKENVEGFLSKILSVGLGGISSDDKDAVEKLKKKMEKLVEVHRIMKAANAYYRKHKTIEGCPDITEKNIEAIKEDEARFKENKYNEGVSYTPFATYQLSYKLAEIKRLKDRIEELEKKENTDYQGWEFDGGEVVFDKEDNRVRILYDGKPDEQTRSELKHRGFRWSPANKAWQRQITRDAIWAAEKVTGKR